MNDKLLSEAGGDNAAQETSKNTADTAGAEIIEKAAAARFGKFESADALYAAYKSLEAEFTRRSQRLKELEEGNKTRDDKSCAPSPEREESGEQAGEPTGGKVLSDKLDEDVKNAVIEEYLKTVASGKSVPLIVGGISSAAPKCAPKTVKEAGALAQTFLKN